MQMTGTRFVISDIQLLDKFLCATAVCNMIICELIFSMWELCAFVMMQAESTQQHCLRCWLICKYSAHPITVQLYDRYNFEVHKKCTFKQSSADAVNNKNINLLAQQISKSSSQGKCIICMKKFSIYFYLQTSTPIDNYLRHYQ